MLNFLYHTALGRIILKPLTTRFVSKVAGAFMDSQLSRILIPKFVKSAGIDVSEYETDGLRSFNEFFYRKIKPGLRTIAQEQDVLIAPADGLLTAYPIQSGLVVPVKQSEYSIARLVEDAELAESFEGGWCLVFRLCVHHYHRYSYIESGVKSANRFIAGKLHTVQPIALERSPVFIENCRDYTVITTRNLGRVVQMEVGALLVGKIENLTPSEAQVERGEEKGRFLYGGSTIIVLVEKERVQLNNEIVEASNRGEETPVKLGEPIGKITNVGA